MEISLKTEGLPPGKDGGISIFNPGHRQHGRVIRLLRQMKRTLDDSQWNAAERREVGLELVMAETEVGFPGDALNYLGGVADVLQANRRNTNLSHLGELAQASLYIDDRQIREVRYSVVEAVNQFYRVRVWILSHHPR